MRPLPPRRRLCPTAWTLVVAALALLAGAAPAQDKPLGLLLVATPGLTDPNFRESVVLVTRHRHGAPVGVILNRPSPLTLGEALPNDEKLGKRQDPIFFGGPVSPRTLVLVYRSRSGLGDSLRVLDDVYVTLASKVIETLLHGVAPDTFRIYAGYAGWAPGQLEAEIERGGWHVLPADAETVFRTDPRTLWRELVERAAPPSGRGSI